MDEIVIKAQSVTKTFDSFEALSGLDLEVKRGQVMGLIGPNGAGKSTFLSSVLGLTDVQGNLEVLGVSPTQNRHELLKKVCSITDVAVMPKWMTVKQVLDYVEGVHPLFNRVKAENLLNQTNISFSTKIRALSRGMVVQLHLSLAMAIDAELLVLDEPTLGLDLSYRKQFYSQLIEDYFDGNKTIIISTHQVEEIEGVLSDVVFIDRGKAIMKESIESLNEKYLELRPKEDLKEKARSLKPFYTRIELGREVFLYEDQDSNRLSELGEVHPPAIADLFLAIVKKNNERGSN
tara:strand:- start:1074 stop:1946 length:873 start_codon:yes stop_codon:yes gene_type:complete